jgi:hypothetical protein
VLHTGKAGGEQFPLNLIGSEKKAEGFARSGDAGGKEVEDFATTAREGFGAEGIVEAQTGAGREMGNGSQGGAKGFEGEVGGDAEPAKKGGEGGVELGLEQPGGKGFVLEVEGDKGEVGRDGDGGLIEHEALPLLSRWEVDLEDMERGEWVAVGKGVEASAEDDILRDALSDGVGELIFSEAATRGHKAAEILGDGVAGSLEITGVAVGDEGQRDGIVEDAGLLHELVSGTADGDAESGSAGLAGFHISDGNGRCGLHCVPPLDKDKGRGCRMFVKTMQGL